MGGNDPIACRNTHNREINKQEDQPHWSIAKKTWCMPEALKRIAEWAASGLVADYMK